MAKKLGIMFETLDILNQLEPMRDPECSEVMLMFLLTFFFFSRIHNYFSNNKLVSMIRQVGPSKIVMKTYM